MTDGTHHRTLPPGRVTFDPSLPEEEILARLGAALDRGDWRRRIGALRPIIRGEASPGRVFLYREHVGGGSRWPYRVAFEGRLRTRTGDRTVLEGRFVKPMGRYDFWTSLVGHVAGYTLLFSIIGFVWIRGLESMVAFAIAGVVFAAALAIIVIGHRAAPDEREALAAEIRDILTRRHAHRSPVRTVAPARSMPRVAPMRSVSAVPPVSTSADTP